MHKLGTVYVGATDCAPTRCHCGARLPRARSGYVELHTHKTAGLDWPTREAQRLGKVWHIVCRCNARYVWAWSPPRNGAWFVYPCWPMDVRHPLPDNGKCYQPLAEVQ